MMSQRFTNYERDANGGDDAQARRFEGQWTRFSQPDPSHSSYRMSDPQSFNRYTYARNDPVNRRDPSGLDDVYPISCPNCYVVVPISFENGVGSTISGLGDLLGRTLYDELSPTEGLNGQTTPQNTSQQTNTVQQNPSPLKQALQEVNTCLREARQAYKQAQQNTQYRGITDGFAIKDHPIRTVAGAVLGGFIGLRLGISGSIGGAVVGAIISEGANDLVVAADNFGHNFMLGAANGNAEIKAFNDCYDKANAKYGVTLQRDAYGYFYTNRYGSRR
jgi:RHS repeat-associated protein